MARDHPQVSVVTDLARLVTSPDQGVVVCLSTPDAVEATLLGEGGAAAGPVRPAWVLDLSTWSPTTAASLGEALGALGVTYVECPVSGGPEGAASGTLTALVRRADLPLVGPLVDALATTVVELEQGSPMAGKLANNLAEALNLWAACEAIALGLAAGLSYTDTVTTIRTMRGGSKYLDVLDGVITGAIDASASLGIRTKDLGLALELAVAKGVDLPLATRLDALLGDWVAVVGLDADQATAIHAIDGIDLASAPDGGTRPMRRRPPT